MLVTAIALFFSTFSSPFLSAALTFGLWVVGHFNADLRNFEHVVDSTAAAGWRAALYYVLPELLGVRRQGAGRARPAGRRGLPGADGALRRDLHRALLLAAAVDFLPAGLQVSIARAAGSPVVAAVLRWPWPSRSRSSATGCYPRIGGAIGHVLYVRSGAVLQRLRALLRRAGGRRLLDSRHSALRRHGCAEPAQKHHYELLYPLLDLTTSLDPHFDIAYRFGAIFLRERYPGGPDGPTRRSRCWRKGLRHGPGEWQYDDGHRVRVLLAPARLHPRGRVVQARRRDSPARRTGCRRWPRRC